MTTLVAHGQPGNECGEPRPIQGTEMNRIEISGQELASIRDVLQELSATYKTVEDMEFVRAATVYAHELPRRIRRFLTDARLSECPSLLVISGYPIDDELIGETPEHWANTVPTPAVIEAQMLFVLFASLLGDVIGWSTQQGGRIMHDVFPIQSDTNEQISTGSEQPIWWHTEDAFHEMRGDYIGLMCLRNPDMVATTVCPLKSVPLGAQQIALLSQARFVIRPDESHKRKNAAAAGNGGGACADFARIEELDRYPDKVSILSGATDEPYIRIDPFFMDPPGDADSQRALDELVRSIDERIQEIVLQPGDCCFIDNFRAVHGRRPFHAKYNGGDRWLKRVNVTRDLRKSRARRESALTRIIS